MKKDMTKPGSFTANEKTNVLKVNEDDCKLQLENFSQYIKNLGKIAFKIN